MTEFDSQQQIAEIAQTSQLTNVQLQAALLDACGVETKIIERRLNRAEGWLGFLRWKNPEYKKTVKEFYAIIAKKIVDEAGDIGALFNQQIGPSTATLIEIRDSKFEKGADRIKAALAFLDRAPAAPKATQQTDVRQMVMQIPVAKMEGIREALIEDGGMESREVLELLEGDGGGESVEVVDDDKNENGEKDEGFSVIKY